MPLAGGSWKARELGRKGEATAANSHSQVANKSLPSIDSAVSLR
jgi:hypothetical protein